MRWYVSKQHTLKNVYIWFMTVVKTTEAERKKKRVAKPYFKMKNLLCKCGIRVPLQYLSIYGHQPYDFQAPT
jgi:hypothetical protein